MVQGSGGQRPADFGAWQPDCFWTRRSQRIGNNVAVGISDRVR